MKKLNPITYKSSFKKGKNSTNQKMTKKITIKSQQCHGIYFTLV